MSTMLIGGAMLKYYTDFIGLDPIIYGIAFLIYGIWNGINDIFIGYSSDRLSFHPKKGKRKRLMKTSLPFAVIGFFLLIFNQPTWSSLIIFIILVTGFCVFDLALTIFGINYAALLLEVSEDPNERGSISVITGWLNFVPMAIISYLPLLILTGDYSFTFIVSVFTFVGVISFTTALYSFIKVEEPFRDHKADPDPVPPFTALKECLKFKSFRYNMVIGFAMNGIGSFGSTVLFVLFDVYELTGLPALLPPIIAGALQPLMMPIILKIQRKIGFRKVFIIFVSLAFVGFLGFMLIMNYWLMCVFYFFILSCYSANAIAYNGYGSVPIYEDYLEKGTQRAGMFNGVNAIFSLPASGIFIFVFTIFLTTYGYDGTSTTGQTAEAMIGIRVGMALLPLIFLAIAIYLMLKYPLNEEEFRQLMKDIQVEYSEDNSKPNKIEEKNNEI